MPNVTVDVKQDPKSGGQQICIHVKKGAGIRDVHLLVGMFKDGKEQKLGNSPGDSKHGSYPTATPPDSTWSTGVHTTPPDATGTTSTYVDFALDDTHPSVSLTGDGDFCVLKPTGATLDPDFLKDPKKSVVTTNNGCKKTATGHTWEWTRADVVAFEKGRPDGHVMKSVRALPVGTELAVGTQKRIKPEVVATKRPPRGKG